MSKITIEIEDTVETRTLLRILADHCLNDNIPLTKMQHSLAKISEDDMNKDVHANLAFNSAVHSALDKG